MESTKLVQRLYEVEQRVYLQDGLWSAAKKGPERLVAFLERFGATFHDEVADSCLSYLAQNGLNPSAKEMAAWLQNDDADLKELLNPDGLPPDIAQKATSLLNKWSANFLPRFTARAEKIADPVQQLRALTLVPALGDYGSLRTWIGHLARQGDHRVRSRAVKLMCLFEVNKDEVELQLRDSDARVRANAVELLWYATLPEAVTLLTLALSDGNHRVVGNALVGLYLQSDPSVMARIAELCQSPDLHFRAAMAWCLGFIQQEEGIAMLQTLANDPEREVRRQAALGLLILDGDVTQAEEARPAAAQTSKAF